MDEFDIDLNGDLMGTNISKLKDNADTDIDYDNIIDNLKMSETNNCSNGMCGRPSMNNFVKKLERDLDNYPGNDNPLPSNYTKKMEPQNKLQSILPSEIANVVEPPKESIKENNYSDYLNKIKKIVSNNLFIYSLLFILLNNNIIVNLIDKMPKINNLQRFHINLIIRTLLFVGIIYVLKNNKILNI